VRSNNAVTGISPHRIKFNENRGSERTVPEQNSEEWKAIQGLPSKEIVTCQTLVQAQHLEVTFVHDLFSLRTIKDPNPIIMKIYRIYDF